MHTYVMLRYSVMVCEVGGNSGAVGGSNNSSGASHTISPPNLGNIEIPISVQEPSKMSQKLLLPYRSRTHALFMISENLQSATYNESTNNRLKMEVFPY